MFAKRITNILAAFLGAAILASATSAAAQVPRGPCAPRSEVVSWLESRYQERQAGFGLIGSRAVMELYKSDKGTWTLITTDRAKRTCLVASGNSWVDVPPPATDVWLMP